MAGGAALVVRDAAGPAVVGRSLTRPLTQLAAAAEDIAAGNYSRRVGIRGEDEIGMLGAAFDRMAEAVERARKVQRDFLANVSHELKTPLTSLIGFSQALVDGSLKSDAERARAATIVHEESERVLRMAQELLDLARVEAGSISIHITAVDLGAPAASRSSRSSDRAPTRRDLDARRSTCRPTSLRWPPTPSGCTRSSTTCSTTRSSTRRPASTVTVSARSARHRVETVISNPAGAHQPDPDRMFERFYRADPSRSRRQAAWGWASPSRASWRPR